MFDRTDQGDMKELFNLCLWLFFTGASAIMVIALFGGEGLPPEPQWWVELRATILTAN